MCKWKKTPENTHFSILRDNSLKHKVNTIYYTKSKVTLEWAHNRWANTLHKNRADVSASLNVSPSASMPPSISHSSTGPADLGQACPP